MARRSAPSALGTVLSSMMILLLLSGCSNDVSKTQQEETTVTAASGIEFDPHMPYAPGEFNAEDPNFILRNICEDYTDDMAAELELGKRFPVDPDFLSNDYHICHFVPTTTENFDSIFLVIDKIPKQRVIERMTLFRDPHKSQIQGTYTYLPDAYKPSDCTAAYSTQNGRVSLTYAEYQLLNNPEQLCEKAVSTLEKIMIRIGGNS